MRTQLTHHDGVTGTSKQHVAYDYARRIALGASVAQLVVGDALASQLQAPASVSFVTCPLLNESVCPETMGQAFQVAVYNPLPHNRTAHLRFPVTLRGVAVIDAASGASIPAEILVGKSHNELVLAVDLCAFCTRLLRVRSASSAVPIVSVPQAVTYIENEFLRVTIDTNTGRITRIHNKEENIDLSVDQGYYWYEDVCFIPTASLLLESQIKQKRDLFSHLLL